MDFYNFYDKLNGEPYSDPKTPPPLEYSFLDYCKAVSPSGSSFNGTEDGTWELSPIDPEDFAQAAHDDVVDAILNKGNTTALGTELDDEGFRRYTGIKNLEQ